MMPHLPRLPHTIARYRTLKNSILLLKWLRASDGARKPIVAISADSVFRGDLECAMPDGTRKCCGMRYPGTFPSLEAPNG
jgi:hypothetical protein